MTGRHPFHPPEFPWTPDHISVNTHKEIPDR